MRNLIQMAERADVGARTINTENRDDWDRIRGSIERDEFDVLLVSPERFNTWRPHRRPASGRLALEPPGGWYACTGCGRYA